MDNTKLNLFRRLRGARRNIEKVENELLGIGKDTTDPEEQKDLKRIKDRVSALETRVEAIRADEFDRND